MMNMIILKKIIPPDEFTYAKNDIHIDKDGKHTFLWMKIVKLLKEILMKFIVKQLNLMMVDYIILQFSNFI